MELWPQTVLLQRSLSCFGHEYREIEKACRAMLGTLRLFLPSPLRSVQLGSDDKLCEL